MRLLTIAAALMAVTFAAAQEEYPLRDATECTIRAGLPNLFAKLDAGESVRIGYLGGSITAQPGWRPLTLQWFREQYPDAQIDEINAAIGGTGSNLGVFRLQHDVLQYEPDLLFVEFAVNDSGASPSQIHRAMEGIVRQTWAADPTTDICYVYTLTQGMLGDLQGGKFPRAASAMEELADFYEIPSIHMGLEVARMERAGDVVFAAPQPKTDEEKAALEGKVLFSGDGVHPYPETGHPLYLAAVARGMEQIRGVGTPGAHTLGDPFVADNWEAAKLEPLERGEMSEGWQKLDATAEGLAKRFSDRLPALWLAADAGTSISFQFKGTQVGMYDLLGPDCGQVKVTLDGGEPRVIRRIDPYCTYHRLASMTIGSGLEDTVHTVTIEVDSEVPDKREILFEHNRPDFDKNPEKYEGTNWYVGAIMLIGDLVE